MVLVLFLSTYPTMLLGGLVGHVLSLSYRTNKCEQGQPHSQAFPLSSDLQYVNIEQWLIHPHFCAVCATRAHVVRGLSVALPTHTSRAALYLSSKLYLLFDTTTQLELLTSSTSHRGFGSLNGYIHSFARRSNVLDSRIRLVASR